MAAIMIRPRASKKPQGAENSAVKNTAPFSLTPLRISENASIPAPPVVPGLSAKFPGLRAKQSASAGRSSKSWRRSGMDLTSRMHCTIVALKRTPRKVY